MRFGDKKVEEKIPVIPVLKTKIIPTSSHCATSITPLPKENLPKIVVKQKCPYCDNNFVDLKKHLNTCSKKKSKEFEQTVKQLQERISMLEQQGQVQDVKPNISSDLGLKIMVNGLLSNFKQLKCYFRSYNKKKPESSFKDRPSMKIAIENFEQMLVKIKEM